jgi:hypothetical protein
MAWGLYVHEDHEKVLDWKLPTSSRDILDMLMGSTPLVKNKLYSKKKGEASPKEQKIEI